MPRILLVDDDGSLLEVLSLALQDAGYDVIRASDGGAGWAAIRAHGPDIVVSDVNMPVLDGFTLCRRVRESGSGVPFLLLTSRDDEIDEAIGFEHGADDYVSKPFSTRILLARIAALLRREKLRSGGTAGVVVRIGQLSLDAERLEVRFTDVPLETTLTEFRILEAMTKRPGVVFSRARLLEHVRGDDSVVAERIVDTYVKRLRRKLEAIDPTFDRIETVVGAGYRWRA